MVLGAFATVAHPGLLAGLLAWHDQDPPDAVEIWRNEVVFEHRRNRNPIIDHLEWVRCVFLQDCGIFADGFEAGDTSAWQSTCWRWIPGMKVAPDRRP